ncbi:hypothetical protein Tco_0181307, partial [Tanacetum coccineum]
NLVLGITTITILFFDHRRSLVMSNIAQLVTFLESAGFGRFLSSSVDPEASRLFVASTVAVNSSSY